MANDTFRDLNTKAGSKKRSFRLRATTETAKDIRVVMAVSWEEAIRQHKAGKGIPDKEYYETE